MMIKSLFIIVIYSFPQNYNFLQFISIDKQYPTQGNWAHIRYATRAEKERAMALSGRQVLPGVMVGVIECKEPPRISFTSPGIMSPERYNIYSLNMFKIIKYYY